MIYFVVPLSPFINVITVLCATPILPAKSLMDLQFIHIHVSKFG